MSRRRDSREVEGEESICVDRAHEPRGTTTLVQDATVNRRRSGKEKAPHDRGTIGVRRDVRRDGTPRRPRPSPLVSRSSGTSWDIFEGHVNVCVFTFYNN